jgi:hypothetical protein
MHAVPFTRRLVIDHAVCVILPLLPLVFLKYPFRQVAARLFHVLSGL